MRRTQPLGNKLRNFPMLLPAVFLAAVVTTALADKKDDSDQAKDRDNGKAPLVVEAPVKDVLTVDRRHVRVLADRLAERRAHASERRKKPGQPERDPIFDSLSGVPHVTGPIPQNEESYQLLRKSRHSNILA